MATFYQKGPYDLPDFRITVKPTENMRCTTRRKPYGPRTKTRNYPDSATGALGSFECARWGLNGAFKTHAAVFIDGPGCMWRRR